MLVVRPFPRSSLRVRISAGYRLGWSRDRGHRRRALPPGHRPRRRGSPPDLSEPPGLRPQLEETLLSSLTKPSTETLDVGTSKVQRIASLTCDKKKKKVACLRLSRCSCLGKVEL